MKAIAAGVLSLAALGQIGGGAPPVLLPHAEIIARLDPAAHWIEATAVLALRGIEGRRASFEIAPSLRVREVLQDGEDVRFEVVPPEKEGGLARIELELPRPAGGLHRYRVRYDGEIHDPPSIAQFSRDRVADQTRGTIQAEGVFLPPGSGWYPRLPGMKTGTFKLEASLPGGWDAVAEGSLVLHTQESPRGVRVGYEARKPVEGLHLVAGPWKRFEQRHGAVTVAAYLYPEDADLAEPYLAGIKRYLDLYSKWLGPYPWDRFAVVENFFSTGYGMPGFTLLGRDVMKLPFIIDTSLGHEVAHCWWGNGVLVDESGGNWSEGLTTFVADYHYKRLESEAAAAEYRREVCRDYTNYVGGEGAEFPLSEFTERTTPATRAVGYGKTLMVFHMLERRLGRERFDRALRRVYAERLHAPASWETWRHAFSREAGEDLGWFFDQWVRRAGAPALSLAGWSSRRDPSGRARVELSGEIRQEGGRWRVEVPLVIEGGGRVERRTVEIRDARTPVRLSLDFEPEVLRVDPEQDVFRRLDPAEMPPVLSRVLGDRDALVVVDDGVGESTTAALRGLADTLTRSGMGRVVAASAVDASALRHRSVLLLGMPRGGPLEALLAGLPAEVVAGREAFEVAGRRYEEPGASFLAIGRNPHDASRAVAVFWGLSPPAIEAAGRKLVHYGKYSYLAFVDGKNLAKGVARVDDGPLVLRF